MQVVVLKAFNDHWYNQKEVEQQCLPIRYQDTVCFRILEGVCLYHTGIYYWIKKWQHKTGRPNSSIVIDTLNKYQPLPWSNINTKYDDVFLEHFIDSQVYTHRWQHHTSVPHAKKFGLFVGRRTAARCTILHDCSVLLSDDFLISAMTTDQTDLFGPPGDMERWGDKIRIDKIKYWNITSSPTSLDEYHVDDVYRNYQKFDFITSLNPFYQKFEIEIVAETMLRGATFWPTEKTVRPIVAKKPWIVMATHGFLSELRRLGFRTFGDYWDERYDVLEGEHRWEAIQSVIQGIIDMPDNEYRDMLRDLTTVCEHNYNHLRTWWKNG